MPLFQYFGWVGSFLLAALFATNWFCPMPIAAASQSDVPLDIRFTSRIATDHKWPERVVLDTTRSALPQDAKADRQTDVGGNETAVLAERQPFEAFAEMAHPARPCFRTLLHPRCRAGSLTD